MAAVLACGPGAVLSHRSAARLQELRNWGYTRIEVTVPRRSRRAHEGVRVHCSTTLSEADITEVNGIPVTTVSRTLFDLAEVVTQRQLERAFDQAEILEALDLNAINDQLARNSTRPGARKVRKVLAEHYIGGTATWSENEELLLSITRPLGIPDPATNQFIVLDDGGPAIRADFVWWEQKVGARSGQPQVAPLPPALRARPPARSASDRRRLAGDPHYLAPDETAPARAASDPAEATGTRASKRLRETSRCRRPSARASS